MNKRLLFLSILFLLPLASFCQASKEEPYGYDLYVGAKVGLNFNKVAGQNWLDEYRTNPSAGLFVIVNGRKWGLQVEGLWSMNSMVTDTSFAGLYQKYFNASKDSLATGKFSFHSFSIPVLVNYKLSEILWLQAGPQYTSLLKVIDKNDLIQSGETIFREGELAMVGGVWLNIGKLGPIPKFNLGARYIAGLNSINELGDQSKWRNQRIQIHFGLAF